MPDGPWTDFQSQTQSAPASGPWSDYAPPTKPEPQGFWSSAAEQLNPIPALKSAWERQKQEGAQIGQQLNSGQYGQALNSTLRAIPGADLIRNEGARIGNEASQAWQHLKQGDINSQGGAYEQAVGAVP